MHQRIVVEQWVVLGSPVIGCGVKNARKFKGRAKEFGETATAVFGSPAINLQREVQTLKCCCSIRSRDGRLEAEKVGHGVSKHGGALFVP